MRACVSPAADTIDRKSSPLFSFLYYVVEVDGYTSIYVFHAHMAALFFLWGEHDDNIV